MNVFRIWIVGVALLASTLSFGQELPRKGAFGAQLVPVEASVRESLKLDPSEGLALGTILPNQTAEKAGLKAGDILTHLAGKPINSAQALVEAMTSQQSGKNVEIRFIRDGKRQTVNALLIERPRETSDKYNVEYTHVVSNGKRMRLLVTTPKTPGPHPVMMLIQGLGPTVMDTPLTGAGAYSKIMYAFATDGYMTLRVDKPGVGDSEGGPYEQVDYLTELDIYRQTLKAAFARQDVDKERVFIFGHSMGGAFGPMVAAEFPIRGICVSGTVSKTWTEYFLRNLRRQLGLAGQSYATIDDYLQGLKKVYHYVLVEGMTADEILKKDPSLRSVVESEMQGGLMYGRTPKFWAQLSETNFPSYWAKTKCHVLALWGASEFISDEEDHILIADMVNKVNPGKGKYVRLDNSDHGFKTTTSMEDSHRRWGQPGGEFNPNVIEAMKTWIKEVLAARPAPLR
jgi:pimeloyl-ACP methyl ester carboxylesterase